MSFVTSDAYLGILVNGLLAVGIVYGLVEIIWHWKKHR